MAVNASDIQITASLIDDYLMTEEAPVGPDPNGRFVAVQDPTDKTPSTELVAVNSSGALVHFYPDASSQSGWSTTTVTVPAPGGVTGGIARLAAFAQSGTTNVLAYFALPNGAGNAATWMQSTAPSTWNQAPLTHDSANALGFTYQTDYYVDSTGNQYLYGVTGNIGSDGAFFLVWFDPVANAWDVLYEQTLDQFTPAISKGAAFRLMPGGNGGLNVLWIDNGTIYWQPSIITNPGTANANFAWSGNVSSYSPGLKSLTIGGIVPLPGSAGQSNLLVIDGGQTLYLIQGYDQAAPSMAVLTGGGNQPAGAASAVAGVDSTGNLMVLLSETTTQALWILRQSGLDNGVPTFDAWVPLGNTVSAVTAPPAMAGGPELFLVDPGLNAYHMSQNLTDLVWATRKVAAPAIVSPTPTNIAGTSMNLTVVDANQAPIADSLISVTSDQPISLVVAGVTYPVGPGVPAQIQADGTGQACVVIETTSLSMPPLTFTVANGDGTTAQRQCQGDQVQVKPGETAIAPAPASVASRLAGNDPNQPLTTTALQSAGLLSPNYADSSDAVSAIRAAGQWMEQHPGTDTNSVSLANVAVKHWRIEFSQGTAPRFTALTPEQGAAYKQKALEASAGSFLSKIFGDVANFFKHAWKELENITVTIADDLTIIFNDVQKFVVTTIREAGQALETIFNRIVEGLTDVYDAIKKAVDWLKQLFEWGDILNTHRVIKAVVNSSLNAAVSSIAAAEAKVKDKFDTLDSEIVSFFQNLESNFQGQSFNAFANSAGTSPIGGSGNVLAAQPASTAYSQNGPRSNYVHNHVKNYYSGTAGGGTTNSAIGNITGLVNSNLAGDTFNAQTQSIQDVVKAKVSDFHHFLDMVIVDLLKAMEELTLFVVKGIEDVVLALLDAAEAAIKGLIAIWNKPIDIPIISWLYKYVITGSPKNPGDDLTVLDALSLILAVPSTILYKILIGKGQAPFTTADVQNIEQNGLPWPNMGTSSPELTEAKTPVLRAAVDTGLNTVLGMLGAVAGFFGTFVSMGADGQAFQESPDKGLKTLLSWATVVTAIVSQVGAAPFSLFESGPSSSADGWTIAFWALSNIPVGADLIFTFATGGLARYTDELGPVLDTALGLIMIILAAITAIEQASEKPPYTGWDQANAVVPQISRFFKFLVMTKGSEAEVVTLPLLLALDLVLGLGSTVTQIGNTAEG